MKKFLPAVILGTTLINYAQSHCIHYYLNNAAKPGDLVVKVYRSTAGPRPTSVGKFTHYFDAPVQKKNNAQFIIKCSSAAKHKKSTRFAELIFKGRKPSTFYGDGKDLKHKGKIQFRAGDYIEVHAKDNNNVAVNVRSGFTSEILETYNLQYTDRR